MFGEVTNPRTLGLRSLRQGSCGLLPILLFVVWIAFTEHVSRPMEPSVKNFMQQVETRERQSEPGKAKKQRELIRG